MMHKSLNGGCYCGKIRYEISSDDIVVVHCHCSNCRRSVGGPFVTWAVVSEKDLNYVGEKPTIHITETKRERGFCKDCGSSISYHKIGQDTIDITVGTFDDPNAVTPSKHIWDRRRIPWMKMEDGLPHYTEWSIGSDPIENYDK